MYDKVKLSYTRTRGTPNISQYIENGIERVVLETGEVSTLGGIKGLRVGIFTGYISIEGSLSRVLYPNNIYPLDRHSTKDAIESLSDSLHLDLTGANVVSLEYGTQYPMAQPVEAYLELLGDMPRMQRTPLYGNSLSYRGRGKEHPKEFVFYDKKADAKAKGMKLPPGFEDANLLKYEMRLNGRLARQLGRPLVQASTLWEPGLYRQLMQLYQDSYNSIFKKEQMKTDINSTINTVGDAFNLFVAQLINQSRPDVVNAFIRAVKAAKIFKDRKNYTRLKNKLEAVSHLGGMTESGELIKELDDAIKNAGAYV